MATRMRQKSTQFWVSVSLYYGVSNRSQFPWSTTSSELAPSPTAAGCCEHPETLHPAVEDELHGGVPYILNYYLKVHLTCGHGPTNVCACHMAMHGICLLFQVTMSPAVTSAG